MNIAELSEVRGRAWDDVDVRDLSSYHVICWIEDEVTDLSTHQSSIEVARITNLLGKSTVSGSFLSSPSRTSLLTS